MGFVGLRQYLGGTSRYATGAADVIRQLCLPRSSLDLDAQSRLSCFAPCSVQLASHCRARGNPLCVGLSAPHSRSVRGQRPAHNASCGCARLQSSHSVRTAKQSAKTVLACVAASRKPAHQAHAFGCGLPANGRSSPTDTTSVDSRLAYQQHAIVRGSRLMSIRNLSHHILWSCTLRRFTQRFAWREFFACALHVRKAVHRRAVNHYRATRILRSMNCAQFCAALHDGCAPPQSTVRLRKVSAALDKSSFDGLRVAAFESRRADEIERMIAKRGGVPFVSPSMREVAARAQSGGDRFRQSAHHRPDRRDHLPHRRRHADSGRASRAGTSTATAFSRR